MKPMISVLMGVYNGEKYLERSILSILNQTYTNWEFIICDDGSTDNTFNILIKYSQEDKRIKPLRNEKNLGLGAALNKCFKYAHGKYIARQDADDISMPNRLEKQVHFLEDHEEYDLVGTSMYLINQMEKPWGERILKEKPERFDLIKRSCFNHATIMARKEMYQTLHGYDEKALRVEDYDLWFRMFEKGFRGFNIDQPLYFCRMDQQDYNRRKYKYRLIEAHYRYKGYKRLKAPFWTYLYAIKPILVGMIPKCFVHQYHSDEFGFKDHT